MPRAQKSKHMRSLNKRAILREAKTSWLCFKGEREVGPSANHTSRNRLATAQRRSNTQGKDVMDFVPTTAEVNPIVMIFTMLFGLGAGYLLGRKWRGWQTSTKFFQKGGKNGPVWRFCVGHHGSFASVLLSMKATNEQFRHRLVHIIPMGQKLFIREFRVKIIYPWGCALYNKTSN